MIENKFFNAFVAAVQTAVNNNTEIEDFGEVTEELKLCEYDFKNEVEFNLLNMQNADTKGRYLVRIIEYLKNMQGTYYSEDFRVIGEEYPFWCCRYLHNVILILSVRLKDESGLQINPATYSMAPPVRNITASKLPQMEASIKNMEAVEEEQKKREFKSLIYLLMTSNDSEEALYYLENKYQEFEGDKHKLINKIKNTISQEILKAEEEIKVLSPEQLHEKGTTVEEYQKWLNRIYPIRDFIFNWIDEEEKKNKPKAHLKLFDSKTPETFDELFYNPDLIEPCIEVLKELQPKVINLANVYIGNKKGVIPIWIKVLEQNNIIRVQKPLIYRDLLNAKFKGLNLSKDASEFRKHYTTLSNVEIEIKALLSQFSQNGKLGK